MENEFTLLLKKFKKFMKKNYILPGGSSFNKIHKQPPKKVPEDKHNEYYEMIYVIIARDHDI